MSVYQVHAWCLQRRPEEFPGTGVTDGFEPSCECWELNVGHLEELEGLLTAEPSLQLLFCLAETIGLVFIIQLPHLPIAFRPCCWRTTRKAIFAVCLHIYSDPHFPSLTSPAPIPCCWAVCRHNYRESPALIRKWNFYHIAKDVGNNTKVLDFFFFFCTMLLSFL